MTILQSKDWRATEGTDLTGGDRKLVVTGQVELSSINLSPVLREAVPQGINPRILLLDLGEERHGDVGGDATTWEPAAFEKAIGHRQYDQVEIRGQATVDVEELIS